ncbi:tetratricopeptide repeat protein [Streptomyces sp. NPDC054949]
MTHLSRMGQATSWVAWAGGAPAPWHLAALEEARALMEEGRFEDAEARARALVAARRSRNGRDRRPATVWYATYVATLAARIHGRQEASLLAELDALIAEAERTYGVHHNLLLPARLARAWALIDVERAADAETEAQNVLRSLARRANRAEEDQLELSALLCFGDALCAQGRYEESETIARAHLPRAFDAWARSLRILLIRSLSGQERHEEALTESLQALPKAPAHGVGHLELYKAAALHALGRNGEAQAEANRALAACERYLHPTHLRIAAIRALLSRIPPP